MRDYMGDPAKAQELLTSPAQRDQRNAVLGSLVNQKQLMLLVKAEGWEEILHLRRTAPRRGKNKRPS